MSAAETGLKLIEVLLGGDAQGSHPHRMEKTHAEHLAEMGGWQDALAQETPFSIKAAGAMTGFLLSMMFVIPRLRKVE